MGEFMTQDQQVVEHEVGIVDDLACHVRGNDDADIVAASANAGMMRPLHRDAEFRRTAGKKE